MNILYARHEDLHTHGESCDVKCAAVILHSDHAAEVQSLKDLGQRIDDKLVAVTKERDAALTALEGVKKEQSRVARLILRVRDLIAANDLAEAYHQLYAIADPTSTSFTPWAKLAELSALPADGGGE